MFFFSFLNLKFVAFLQSGHIFLYVIGIEIEIDFKVGLRSDICGDDFERLFSKISHV